jgi:hypothetical protein
MHPSLFVEKYLTNVSLLIKDMVRTNERYDDMMFNMRSRTSYDEPAQAEGWVQCFDDQGNYHNKQTGEFSLAGSWEELCDEQHYAPYQSDVMGYYIIEPCMVERFKEEGELVMEDFFGLCLWGRCTTGQSVHDDGVIQRIAEVI